MLIGSTLSYGGTPLSAGRTLSASTRFVTPGPPASNPVASSGAYTAGARVAGQGGQATSVVVRRLNSQSSAASLPGLPQYAQALGLGSGVMPPMAQVSTVGSSPAAAVVSAVSGQRALAAGEETSIAADESYVRVRAVTGETGQSNDVEALRRSLVVQEERIAHLSHELKASREREGKLSAEVEAAHAEMARLMEDLQLERAARERAEHAIMNQQQAVMTPSATRLLQDDPLPTAKSMDSEARSNSVRRGPAAARQSPVRRVQAAAAAAEVQSARPASSRRAQSPNSTRTASGKDEIEPRLREFLERTKCNLIFRQLNRGWYAFRRVDEKGPLSNDRSVELSIVNGKLMVKLEPSTHDPGWNNGKPGPIERFIAKHSEE